MEGLTAWILPMFGLIITFVRIATGTVTEISTEGEHYDVMEQETITLPCAVSGEYDPWVDSLTWIKSKTIEGVPTEHEINANSILKSPFSEAGRFRLTVTRDPVAIDLLISGAQTEDTGEYRCQLLGKDDKKSHVTHTLEVAAPLEDMMFSATSEEIKEELIFKFDDVSKTNITCTVIGGNPQPEIDVLIGNDPITSDFEVDRQDTITGPEGLEKIKHHIILTNKPSYQPDTKHHGETMLCRAVIRGIPDMTEKTALVDIRFAPVFLGCIAELDTMVGEEDYQIECKVRANPPVDKSTVTWMFKMGDEPTNLTNGNEIDVYSTSSEENDDGTEIIFRLHISTVNETNFQTYTLMVSNEVDEREHQILLYERTTTINPPTNKPPRQSVEDGNSGGSSLGLRYVLTSTIPFLLALLLSIV